MRRGSLWLLRNRSLLLWCICRLLGLLRDIRRSFRLLGHLLLLHWLLLHRLLRKTSRHLTGHLILHRLLGILRLLRRKPLLLGLHRLLRKTSRHLTRHLRLHRLLRCLRIPPLLRILRLLRRKPRLLHRLLRILRLLRKTSRLPRRHPASARRKSSRTNRPRRRLAELRLLRCLTESRLLRRITSAELRLLRCIPPAKLRLLRCLAESRLLGIAPLLRIPACRLLDHPKQADPLRAALLAAKRLRQGLDTKTTFRTLKSFHKNIFEYMVRYIVPKTAILTLLYIIFGRISRDNA